MKVYLATSGEYSSYRVLRVFANEADARAYELGEDVEEFEVDDGPAEVRHRFYLSWCSWQEDSELTATRAANPHISSILQDFDSHPPRGVTHQWASTRFGQRLAVEGWDLEAVRKVYSEQRAQHVARTDMGVEESQGST